MNLVLKIQIIKNQHVNKMILILIIIIIAIGVIYPDNKRSFMQNKDYLFNGWIYVTLRIVNLIILKHILKISMFQ